MCFLHSLFEGCKGVCPRYSFVRMMLVLFVLLVSLEWGLGFLSMRGPALKAVTSMSAGFEDFQTGQHTYAFWSNPRDSLYNGKDYIRTI